MKKFMPSSKYVVLGCLAVFAWARLSAEEPKDVLEEKGTEEPIAKDIAVTTITAPGGIEITTEAPVASAKEEVEKAKKVKKDKKTEDKAKKVKETKVKEVKVEKKAKAEKTKKEPEAKAPITEEKQKAYQEISAKFIGALAAAQAKLKAGGSAGECLEATLSALLTFFNEKVALHNNKAVTEEESSKGGRSGVRSRI